MDEYSHSLVRLTSSEQCSGFVQPPHVDEEGFIATLGTGSDNAIIAGLAGVNAFLTTQLQQQAQLPAQWDVGEPDAPEVTELQQEL